MTKMNNKRVLSQLNINELHLKGLYKSLSYQVSDEVNNYSVGNWTFTVVQSNDKHYMKCTMTDNLIELTDDNFDDFVVMFKNTNNALHN